MAFLPLALTTKYPPGFDRFTGSGKLRDVITPPVLKVSLEHWASKVEHDNDFFKACVSRMASALETIRNGQEDAPLTFAVGIRLLKLMFIEIVRLLSCACAQTRFIY